MWRSDMFHDVSLLSPVREEEEPLESPCHRRPRPRSRSRSPLLPPVRPYSPLPPLIIEVEKRVNKHDEPEEFYVRLEKKMKRIYRRLFIEGRDISSDMSIDHDDDDYVEHSNDDNRSDNRSNGNIVIDEGTVDGGHIEPIVISSGSLKRGTNNDSSESDEEEVIAKKSKRNHSSRADKPRSSSEEEIEHETTASSIAEEDFLETEGNVEETHYANVVDSVYESYMERDDVEYTSESLDCIQVTFQADVHRAYSDETNDDLLPPANVGDEMNVDGGDDSANESVKDPEVAEEEIESLENNEVSENSSSSAPDGGLDRTTSGIQPDGTHDAEPASEGIGEPLEKEEVPHNNLLAPAPDREVDIMRTPLIRPSAGSLPEHINSNDEEPIDFEFLNRTQENAEDDAIEDKDAETQTSIEETSPEDWGNIFHGKPRVFKLCHCRNHVCLK